MCIASGRVSVVVRMSSDPAAKFAVLFCSGAFSIGYAPSGHAEFSIQLSFAFFVLVSFRCFYDVRHIVSPSDF